MSRWTVLMAGGSGTRFWPASRSALPKQFLAVTHPTRSLLGLTYDRMAPLVPIERTVVVTHTDQAALSAADLPGLPADNILAEPCARNTAACCIWAALEIGGRDPDAVLAVLPADHLIPTEDLYREVIEAAFAHCESNDGAGALMTFGIAPTGPATGYGYIRRAEQVSESGGHPIHRVEAFLEKPDLERAAELLDAGDCDWNSGMFVWRADALVREAETHLPDLTAALRAAFGDRAALEAAYGGLEKVPVDIGVMERSDNVVVMPAPFTWSDVGSWAAAAELSEADPDGNATRDGGGRTVFDGARDNFVWSEGGHTVALLDVEGLVVVHTPDATLVCPRERAEEVKRLVGRLPDDLL